MHKDYLSVIDQNAYFIFKIFDLLCAIIVFKM